MSKIAVSTTVNGDAADFTGNFRGKLFVQIQNGHARACSRQASRGLRTQSGGAACHQCR